MGDDAYMVAEPLGVLDQVRAEEDRPAGALKVGDDLAESALVQRIEAPEGFVQDDDLGLVEDRGDELELLLHPLRQVLDAVVSAIGQVEPLEPVGDPGPGHAWPETLELGQKLKELLDPHPPVEPALLGEIADPVQDLPLRESAEEPDLALVGREDPEEDPDRGRLPGAVRPQKPVGRALGDDEVQVPYGDQVAIPLGDARQGDGGGGDVRRPPLDRGAQGPVSRRPERMR
jgi:hypothetical protein